MKLNIYKFKDGINAYFLKNKKSHLISGPDDTMSFNVRFEHVKVKQLNIKYSTWFKLIGLKDVG